MIQGLDKGSVYRSHYIPNTEEDRGAMLRTLGIDSVEELFTDIPEELRNPPLDIPPPMSELELRRELEHLAAQNLHARACTSFLGAGVYNHFSPSIVRAIITRGEFLTAYTPYQAEASQGTLQVTYDFQTLVCNLLGMEIADAGMYDGASALAEAALAACRITGRDRVGLLDTVSPTYRQVIQTYTRPQGIEMVDLNAKHLVFPRIWRASSYSTPTTSAILKTSPRWSASPTRVARCSWPPSIRSPWAFFVRREIMART